jgi:PAS domain S-box-containing protein
VVGWPRSAPARYGVAVGVVAVAALLKWLFDQHIGGESPFLLFFAAVMISAWYGGVRAGLLTTLLAALVADFLFLRPAPELPPLRARFAELLRIAVFLLEGALISWLTELLRQTRRRAEVLLLSEQEIRQRERLSQAAAAAEQRYRDLVNGVDAIVWEADPETLCFQFVSQRAEAILGYPVERWQSEADFWGRLIHADDRERALQLLRRATAPRGERMPLLSGYATGAASSPITPAGQKQDFEFRAVTADGRTVWLRTLVHLARHADGRPYQLRGLMIDATERKQAEERLRESEARFRMMADTAPVLIWMAGADQRCDYFNRPWLEFTGRTVEQELGDGWVEGVHPDDLPTCRATFASAFEARRPFEAEYRLRRADGEYRYVLSRGTPRFAPGGAFLGYIGSAIDLTERRQVEQRLQESEERYRCIAETANEGIWQIGTDARTTYINRRMAELLGCRLEEMTGRSVLEFVFEEDRPLAQERIGQNLRGHSEQFDFRFRRKDGSAVLVLGCTSPVTNGGGRIVGALGMFSDITARKRSEEALRESEARFRHLADAIPQTVWVAAPNGRTEYVNRRWTAYTGLDLDATNEPQRFAEALHPDDRRRVMERYSAALATGAIYNEEFRLRRAADGAYRWFLGRCVPIRDERGQIVRWFGTCTDIDDQKHAEEALRDADRRKDEFLAVLSHELRNPLAPIRNALQLMRMGRLEDPDLTEARDVLERQVHLLAGIVDDLLDVFRITHHKIALHREPIDLAQLIRVTAEDHRIALEGNLLKLTLDLPDEPVWVQADRTRLTQVLANLLNNAAKFTNAGDQITVQLHADPRRRQALVSVHDTGIGIAPEVLPHVFETFAQGDDTLDRSRGGLGLGLALVKGIVQLHGGGVQALSDGLGQGTEIRFWLPLGHRPLEADGTDLPVAPSVRRLRILVIEDSLDTAQTMALLLRRYGHQVTTALTGLAGVEAARQERPDVILCDLGLPEMDGYEVAATLRADPELSAVRLIAISGYGQEEDRRRSEEAGFDLHLTKPVDPVELQRLLAVLKVGS